MVNNYAKEEQFLRVLANAYITHNADELLKIVPDDFGFDTMWRYESKIENKKQYEEYIRNKLGYMKVRLITSEFAMMKDKRDEKPLLLITNSKSPDGGHAVIVVTSDEKGNIKRADITAADFYPLEPIAKDNVIKRTYETLLAIEPHCDVNFTTSKKQVYNYKGVFLKLGSDDSRWGLAHLDDIPDDFCAVYDHTGYTSEARMFTPDTRISVDFIFVDRNNKIIKIHKNAKPLSRETISCENVAYALELKAGQCEKNGINVGDSVKVTPESNMPEPVKCNEKVYEDKEVVITKIWEQNTTEVWNERNDKSATALYFAGKDYTMHMDLDGNVLYYEPANTYIYSGDPSDEGITPVCRNRRLWKLIDKNGVIKPVKYYAGEILDIEDAGEGMFKINIQSVDLAYFWDYDAGRYGFIDKDGNFIVAPDYIWADNFENGRAIVCKGRWYRDKKWNDRFWSDEMLFGIIDKTGKEVVPCVFDEIRSIDGWDDKYFAHSGGWEDGKWGIIDQYGKWVVKPILDGYGYDACGDLVEVIDEEEDKVNYYNIKTNKFLFKKGFEDADLEEDNGLIRVEEYDKKLGREVAKIMDLQGNEILKSKYSCICHCFYGHRLVWINGPDKNDIHKGRKYGYLSADCKTEIVPCVYEQIDTRDTKDAFVFSENGKWGVSDFECNVLIKPQYGKISLLGKYGLAEAGDTKDGLVQLLRFNGNKVLPMVYKYMWFIGEDHLICKTDKKTEMYKITLKK